MLIRPILVAPQLLPSVYDVALAEAMEQVRKFYAAFALPFGAGAVEHLAWPGAPFDYVTKENPWYAVYGYLVPQLGPEEKAVVLLLGWNNSLHRGWGGNPLALVGEYCLGKLATMKVEPNSDPTPLVDDFLAQAILAHEVGHVFSFGHSYQYSHIMNAGCYDWPNVGPSPEMIQAFNDRQFALARLTSLGSGPWLQGESCPLGQR